jgi:hypothetical protein
MVDLAERILDAARSVGRVERMLKALAKDLHTHAPGPDPESVPEEIGDFLGACCESPESFQARQDALRRAGGRFAMIAEDEETPPDFVESFPALWKAWQEYSKLKGLEAQSPKWFGQNLRRRFEPDQKDGKRVYKGIRLREGV